MGVGPAKIDVLHWGWPVWVGLEGWSLAPRPLQIVGATLNGLQETTIIVRCFLLRNITWQTWPVVVTHICLSQEILRIHVGLWKVNQLLHPLLDTSHDLDVFEGPCIWSNRPTPGSVCRIHMWILPKVHPGSTSGSSLGRVSGTHAPMNWRGKACLRSNPESVLYIHPLDPPLHPSWIHSPLHPPGTHPVPTPGPNPGPTLQSSAGSTPGREWWIEPWMCLMQPRAPLGARPGSWGNLAFMCEGRHSTGDRPRFGRFSREHCVLTCGAKSHICVGARGASGLNLLFSKLWWSATGRMCRDHVQVYWGCSSCVTDNALHIWLVLLLSSF